MTEWKELHDPRMSEIFEYLRKGWDVESRWCDHGEWRPVKRRSGAYALIYADGTDYLEVTANRQWRVREPEPKWVDCGMSDVSSLLADCHHVQAAADDEWHDVWTDVYGNIRYKSTDLLVPINDRYKWRYQEKE